MNQITQQWSYFLKKFLSVLGIKPRVLYHSATFSSLFIYFLKTRFTLRAAQKGWNLWSSSQPPSLRLQEYITTTGYWFISQLQAFKINKNLVCRKQGWGCRTITINTISYIYVCFCVFFWDRVSLYSLGWAWIYIILVFFFCGTRIESSGPHIRQIFYQWAVSLICFWDSLAELPNLALNLKPSWVNLQNSWDYKHEPLYPACSPNHTTVYFCIQLTSHCFI